MMARDADSYAGSIGLRPEAVEAPAGLVRPLGAFERLYHLRQQNNTVHFCMATELADDLDPYALDAALLAVQQRHPVNPLVAGSSPARPTRLFVQLRAHFWTCRQAPWESEIGSTSARRQHV
jgi:hypothetical protein